MSAEEVLQLFPGLQRHARPEPEQFANVASTAMTLDQWVHLAKRVNELFEQGSAPGQPAGAGAKARGLSKVIADEQTNSLINVGTDESYAKLID